MLILHSGQPRAAMPESAPPPTAKLDHCCGLLERGKSDEERFVGLLLASKIVAAPAGLRRVCDAALAFLARLVQSPPPPDTVGGGNPYRALALSVLASFLTDDELRSRADVLACAVAAGAAVLGAGAEATDDELRDCASVLGVALCQPAGLAEAVRVQVISSLAAAAASPLPPASDAAPGAAPEAAQEAGPAGERGLGVEAACALLGGAGGHVLAGGEPLFQAASLILTLPQP